MAPLLLRGVQDDAFGLIAFLGTNAGLADRIRGVINRSMVRELGAAYHKDDPKYFLEAFNCALVVCVAAGIFTVLLHGVLIAVLPLFPVSQGLLAAGCWFIVAKAVEALFTVLLAPVFNFYLIDERMPTYNFWLVAIRAGNVLAALGLVFFLPLRKNCPIEDIANNVIVYGFLSAGIATLMLFLPVAYLVIRDARFRPRLSLVSKKGMREIVAVGGWNTGLVIATGSFLPAAGAFMYAMIGELGGRLFGIAMPLTYYVRMLATGMAAGLDAVSTRVTSGKSEVSLQQLLIQSARLNGFVIFPAMLFIVTLAVPIIQIWVGDQLKNPLDVHMSADLVRAMALGAISMGISEAWITIMYGAGYIHRIVPVILYGLLASCFVTPLALWLTPDEWEYLVPAVISSLMIFLSMFVAVAIVVARVLETNILNLVTPLIRPLVASLVMLPILFAFLHYVDDWSLLLLIAAMLLYGGAFTILSWFYVLNKEERMQILNAIRKNRSPQHPPDSAESSATGHK